MILFSIEVCWNLFPPKDHVYASITLFACHCILVLASLVLSKYPKSPYLEQEGAKKLVKHRKDKI